MSPVFIFYTTINDFGPLFLCKILSCLKLYESGSPTSSLVSDPSLLNSGKFYTYFTLGAYFSVILYGPEPCCFLGVMDLMDFAPPLTGLPDIPSNPPPTILVHHLTLDVLTSIHLHHHVQPVSRVP